jgi:DNA-binding CsgD family transcriptional regulator
VLANVVDPIQTASSLVYALDEECAAVALSPDGGVVPLRGEVPDDLCEPSGPAHLALERMRRDGALTTSFVWPSRSRQWLGCRLIRCRNQLDVLTVRPLPDVHGLTGRELEVLAQLVEGHSNGDIAEKLWVTVRTVRAHVEHIMQKLDVSSRAGAVARALEEGLVPPR